MSTRRSPSSAAPRVAVSLLVACALFAGCKPTQTTGPQASATDAGPSFLELASRPIPPERLAPVIGPLAVPGALPTAVVISFAARVVEDERVSRPADLGTLFKISPELDGQLVWTSNSTLTFTPKKGAGFEYGTQYQVTLEKLTVGERVIAPPSPGQWKTTFSTPAFELLSAAPAEIDLRLGKAKLALVFSGPVDVASLAKRVTVALDDVSLGEPKLLSTDDPRTVSAAIASPKLLPGSRVVLKLKEGAAQFGQGKARAGAKEVAFNLYGGRRVVIHRSRMKEGATGFFVELRCEDVGKANAAYGSVAESDDADEGGSDGYYDEEEGEYVHSSSHGCVLQDAEAADGIHFTPAVKFSVAPARGGFRIFGDFKRGNYAMRIDPGVGSVGGGILYGAYEASFTVGARAPRISFSSSGRYLPRSAWKNLAIQHVNLDAVHLDVWHVPPENLVFWLSEQGAERATERTANRILQKDLPVRGAADTQATSWLDVGGLLPATTQGVLELILTAPGVRDTSARLLLTNMTLVAKKPAAAGAEVWVWALGIDSGEPLSGVEISLVRKSGKVLARCSTTGGSGCKLAPGADPSDSAEPFALIARKGDDLTYLRYSDLKTDVSDSEVEGDPYVSERAYRAALYSERGVYRPGETAHLAAILRGRDDLAPPAGMPVELQIIDPRERVTRKVTVKTNDAGLITLDQPFADFADTGHYTVRAQVADAVVGEYGFNVEEFVPERMKVTATTEKPGYALGEAIPVAVEAKYLFGGTPDAAPVETSCRLEPSVFKPKENGNYQYAVWRRRASESKPITLGAVKATLDDKGAAIVKCPAPGETGSFKGPAKLVAQVAVFEAGSGRSTQTEATVPVHPEAYYLGLQSGVVKVAQGKAFTVSGVVVDWNGALFADAKKVRPIEVELLRLEAEYGYSWDEDTGEERYQRSLRPVREGKSVAAVKDGKFSIDVTPAQASAGYLVRVRSGKAQTDLQLEGEGNYYWSGSEERVDQTPRPLKATSIPIAMPALIKVGEKATVKIKAPYSGRALFTVETNKVLTAEWKAVTAGDNEWTFAVDAFAPNAYVSVFLVKDPHLESKEAFLPDRAFGVASVPVEPTAFVQPVVLTVPTEVRSNSPLTVELDLGKLDGPTYATVAAVDEGILSLTRFKSPDPVAAIFVKRRLEVETYETVGWTLLMPPQGNSRSTGGDGEGGAGQGRVQPVKPVALWSGVVPVPASGKATVTFQVPQYRGALRVMAVVSSAKKMGRASAQVKVRDPIVLQTTLPRFLAQGDEVQIPVSVTNLSGGKLEVKVSLSAENLAMAGVSSVDDPSPLQLLGKPEGTITLANEKNGTLVFQARAVKAIGAAKLRVLAKSGEFESREELDVPFVPSGPRERIVQRVELAEGTTDLKPYLKGWTPSTERSTYWVTNNPYGETFDHLRYLIQYPHGCIEQTTSSTRPLLFVSSLIDSVDPSLTAGGKLDDMVLHGINRVFSMQTPSGGFAYWPGETEPNAWGTAYATHMLLDAQKQGYAVPGDRLAEVTAWINKELTRREGENVREPYYGYHQAEPYLHYVAALSGQGRKARIQKLIETLPTRSKGGELDEDLYLLKAALYLSGDRRYEKDLKNPDVSKVTDERANSWAFYSDRRRRGFELSIFEDLFHGDAAGEALANRVAEGLRGHQSGWYTTQELMWGVTGLGKRLATAAADFKPGALVLNGKPLEVRPAKLRGTDRSWAVVRGSESKTLALTLESKGKGNVFLVMSSEGVREKADFKLGGSGLKLERSYHTLDGTDMDVHGAGVALGDLVVVQLTISNTSGERVQNIALVDRLPAGWEIENPRLGRGAQVSWFADDQAWKVDSMNVRDDRLELFGALERGASLKVVYAVRAVTSGKFVIPPVEAEAMYDPRIWAREAGGEVKISGPWEGLLL